MYAWRRACLGSYVHGRFQGSALTTRGTLCSLLCIPKSHFAMTADIYAFVPCATTEQIIQHYHAGIMQPPVPHMDVRTPARLLSSAMYLGSGLECITCAITSESRSCFSSTAHNHARAFCTMAGQHMPRRWLPTSWHGS